MGAAEWLFVGVMATAIALIGVAAALLVWTFMMDEEEDALEVEVLMLQMAALIAIVFVAPDLAVVGILVVVCR